MNKFKFTLTNDREVTIFGEDISIYEHNYLVRGTDKNTIAYVPIHNVLYVQRED